MALLLGMSLQRGRSLLADATLVTLAQADRELTSIVIGVGPEPRLVMLVAHSSGSCVVIASPHRTDLDFLLSFARVAVTLALLVQIAVLGGYPGAAASGLLANGIWVVKAIQWT